MLLEPSSETEAFVRYQAVEKPRIVRPFRDDCSAVLLVALSAFLLAGLYPGPAAGQWVEPPGTGWATFQLAHQDARTRFRIDGNREPLSRDGARSIATTVRLTGALGLWRGIDVWADVPFRRLKFSTSDRTRRSTGISDPRLYLRIGPSLLGIGDLPLSVAVRGGTKFPVGEFAAGAQSIPLSEGQRDWEVLLELGKSLHPWPMYVMGWVGYRWREPNQQVRWKPGDEAFFYAAAGGSAGPFRWKLAFDGLFGQPPVRTDVGLPMENARRELIQALPQVGWRAGPGVIEAGVRVPVSGRNLPASPVFTLGYFVSWSEGLW